MAATGTAFSPMLGLSNGTFDLLSVWYPSLNKYVSVFDAVGRVPELEAEIVSDAAKLQELQDKVDDG